MLHLPISKKVGIKLHEPLTRRFRFLLGPTERFALVTMTHLGMKCSVSSIRHMPLMQRTDQMSACPRQDWHSTCNAIVGNPQPPNGIPCPIVSQREMTT